MPARRKFPPDILAAIETGKSLRVRAGTTAHRFIGIWAVVVEGRVFVRSWSLKPGGWWRTFAAERRGAIQVGPHELSVRAAQIRTERLRRAIDLAYLSKYSGPGSIRYARDLGQPRSRATTTELTPGSGA